jgi:hypothetical protein
MQNVRDYVSVKLHTTARSALKATSMPTYKSHIILDENLIQTNHDIPSIRHNKPLGIGVSILELVNKTFSIKFLSHLLV